MASFTIRVVLHDADWEEYAELHQYMEEKGFSRTITSKSGVTYALPDAEYNFAGDEKLEDVLILAKAAAAKTKRRHSILVTESKGRTWSNLSPQV
ncbi:hypothetical protein [Geomesophilobacter sediminis]|uniref:DUF2622 domain-containing protein n=1 Tax=Geomesophilobacter sediminis TaxID=2798584 RepID=A0A8J7J663_9BACT|nr:hypothetical protein [Geomesophilobacter sediminis]MBJ6724166.1 hypothetical protein [Geomesophilobacter sediminis]